MADQSDQQRFAVLIDGDNAQASLLSQILAEISRSGLITIKRIYGDWTTTNMNSWKPLLHKHAIQPIQQFRYTIGKNATDSAMIIDAMDLLHSNDVDGFGIVSSDSDYTRLATRIREEGLFVIGVGEKKTPEAFVNACNQFIYCENLVDKAGVNRKARKKRKSDAPDPKPLLIQAFEMVAKEEEWVHLSSLGSVLRKLNPAFDPRTFGHERLQSLIKDYPKIFTLKRDDSKTPPVVYVGLTT
ncbi:Maebl [candidate division LCP-89 bacterium B3_LCP]|uniref:Maebl n=1 Tax=candidate division LCP-89 bacterium B3_LCP TaxID=2012998 RepID=A0A532V207_UNCL8|nr:MAG: Maebl [candidate division LCP-89 bacterium B3_LCP]